jgi:hypothetical protein
MKKYAFALIACLVISPVFADDSNSGEKIKLAQQLMAIDGSVAAVQSIKDGMMQQIKQSLPPFVKSDFFTALDGELSTKEILDKQLAIYARVFSEEEMKKSIAFYRSPEGKSIAQKTSQISQEIMFASQQWAQDANERVMLLMQAQNK